MDITAYVERLRTDLASAAATGGHEIAVAAERLAAALDASVRMTLLETLSDAAAEITAVLDDTVVEVRLKGREPQFVVEVADPPADAADAARGADDDDDASTARITLRLPEALKQRAEESAARSRQSLNTWLVEAVRQASRPNADLRGRRAVGRQLSGWAR